MMKDRGLNPNESDSEYDSQKMVTHAEDSEEGSVHELARDVSTKKSKNTIRTNEKMSKASL